MGNKEGIMRRVYLSFLGTNRYFDCNYYKDGFEKVQTVRYVQEATIKWYCHDWNSNDRIFIFTTDEAEEKNWNDAQDDDGKLLQGLKTRLESLSPAPLWENVHIPSGKNRDEIWQIFKTVFEKIEDGDQIYLDITHAFRSLPLLSLVILNYAKVTRNVKIRAISYGAMEAIGPGNKVKEMPVAERNVPVFDLLAFDQLLDWTVAMDRFTGAGDASMVADLAQREISPILRETRGQDQEAQAVRLLAKKMKELSDAIATCRARTIPGIAAHLKDAFEDAKRQKHIKPLSPLFEKLDKQINRFSGDEIRDGLTAVQWCLDHNLVQQGITIFLETLVSHVIKQALSGDIHDKTIRDLVNPGLHIYLNNVPEDRLHELTPEDREMTCKIIEWFRENEEVAKCFSNLIEPRNDINHAGQRESPMSPSKFSKKLEDELKRFRQATEA